MMPPAMAFYHLIISGTIGMGMGDFVAVCLLMWAMVFLFLRVQYSHFIIDEKGIICKFFGRDVFIAWDEMEYIGVGAIWEVAGYRYMIYFAKIRPQWRVFRRYRNQYMWQNKDQFFIRYQEGMLEEVLKYVDETRIRDVELIKNCKYPHAMQLSEPKLSAEDW